jgi:hypothetical protein
MNNSLDPLTVCVTRRSPPVIATSAGVRGRFHKLILSIRSRFGW